MSYKFTDERREFYLTALRSGYRKEAAARECGITSATASKWRRQDPIFAQECNEAECVATGRVVKRLYDKAMAGDTTALIFWVTNRDPDEWRDRRAVSQDPVLTWIMSLPEAERELFLKFWKREIKLPNTREIPHDPRDAEPLGETIEGSSSVVDGPNGEGTQLPTVNDAGSNGTGADSQSQMP